MQITTFASVYMLLGITVGYDGTATHYNIDQGGRPACCPERDLWDGKEKDCSKFEVGKYCGAPTDGADFWTGPKCMCSGNDPECKNGTCEGCCDKSNCTSGCPKCLVNG